MKELFNRSLPKWPQMIVTGKPVTQEQALEIIRRTDTFITSYQSGNNRSFVEKAKKVLKLKDYDDFNTNDRGADWDAYHNWRDNYHNKWGSIDTEYVHNSWISCSFIGGTHGWCNPNGQIKYYDNIGKWPSIEEVYSDWVKIAEAFPFLEIGVTLMSGESCEDYIEPVVSFKIANGEVNIIDPEITDVHNDFKNVQQTYKSEEKSRGFPSILNKSAENAIPLDILQEWGKKI